MRIITIIAFVFAIVGCESIPTIDPAAGIDKASGRISARAGFIEDQADQIINAKLGTPVEVVKPHAETIKVEAKNITIDQAEVDRLMAEERKAHVDSIESLESQLRESQAKPFYLVKLIGSVAGLVGIVVGIYFGISGKVWLNGGALALSGVASLIVALLVQHTGWLIAVIIVSGLAVVFGFIVIETVRRMKRAAVSIPQSIRKLEVAGKLRLDDDAKALLDETQTPLAKKYVNEVTNPVRKSKEGR